MGVATGGRHTVTVAIIILIPEHTVAPITEATVIIIQRLTMIPLRVPMGGNRQLMVRTDRQRVGRVTILTQGLMHEAPAFRHLTAAEVQPKPTIHTPGPMLRPDKARALTLSGVVPMFHAETRALPWVTTQPRTAP
jgi:hypothetical protein